ncbi:MAG: integrase family protein [Caulobacter sp.]|nr:integrase family protein [Caulobacter sp.]
MRRTLNKLTAKQVASTKKIGWLGDGGGLWLRTQASGKSWVFVYAWNNKRCEVGLGAALVVGLADAREKAKVCRETVSKGIDPRAVRAATAEANDRRRTFGEVADEYIADHEAGWANDKHKAQWKMTLKVYAAPLRQKFVDEITADDVLACPRPIWTEKAETADRTRGRIAKVLSAARARGLRTGENPAAWTDNLSHRLDKRARLTRGHHAAMPIKEVAAFTRQLRERQGPAAKALTFTILTAARTSEVTGATWGELDLEAKMWTVPAERMKMKREHTVPLSDAAPEILSEAQGGLERAADAFVFPGLKPGGLSNMAMENVMRKAGAKPSTVHGFRSTFRDWAGTKTEYPRELAEEALAHLVGDETERAYKRTQAIERRRPLMDDWAAFCEAGEVIHFKARSATGRA